MATIREHLAAKAGKPILGDQHTEAQLRMRERLMEDERLEEEQEYARDMGVDDASYGGPAE